MSTLCSYVEVFDITILRSKGLEKQLGLFIVCVCLLCKCLHVSETHVLMYGGLKFILGVFLKSLSTLFTEQDPSLY